MNWKIAAVGTPSLGYAKAGIDEYMRRLVRYGRVELDYVREGPRPQVEERLARAAAGGKRIVMDERGKQMTTEELRQLVDRWEMAGEKRITLVIGGADGHSEEFRSSADAVWGLSRLTLQHELALVVLLEQIYRVGTMRKGEPYHR